MNESGPDARSYPISLAELGSWRQINQATTEEARRRLVQFVVLASIPLSGKLSDRLALKGGNALRFIYGNNRSTIDLDYTALGDFPDDPEQIRMLLDEALRSSERRHQVKTRCQSVRRDPKNKEKTRPTYQIRVCFQLPGDRYYQDFEQRKVIPEVVELEISLNDLVCETEEKRLSSETDPILVCALEDLIAEKLRALLQQVIRNRSRPQDVFDIASRMRHYGERINLAKVSDYLLRKAQVREIAPRKSSFDEEVRRRSMVDYDEQIGPASTWFIPFDDAWNEVIRLVNKLAIPD